MLRTRPAGVVMIVIATLVSTSTAYLLATRTMEQVSPAETAVTVPEITFDNHQIAVQATLLCLTAAGMAPITEPARGRAVTRITVDRKSLDLEAAEAAIADCREKSNLQTIDQARAQLLLTAISERAVATALFQRCLAGSGEEADAELGWSHCYDETVAATGLQPAAARQ